MMNFFSRKRAQQGLEKGYKKAERILNDPYAIEKFLHRLEKKLKAVPRVGEKLSYVPIMLSLLLSFSRKEYTIIPMGIIIAITSALAYFLSPIDFVPDFIPFFGYVDDAAVLAVCWNMVKSDVEEYVKWRKDNGMVFDL